MKEKFNSIPEALQKQIIIRVGASGLSLLLVVVVIAMYRDVYLSLAFVLFFLFFGASGVFMFWNAAKGRYIAIEGECTEVERTTLPEKAESHLLHRRAAQCEAPCTAASAKYCSRRPSCGVCLGEYAGLSK